MNWIGIHQHCNTINYSGLIRMPLLLEFFTNGPIINEVELDSVT